MSTYESIQKSINDLKIDASEGLMDLLVELHDQFNHASNAKWTREDLSKYIKCDNDVLDSDVVNDETVLWAEIREIQDSIIDFFGE